MRKIFIIFLFASFIGFLGNLGNFAGAYAELNDASEYTKKINSEWYSRLDFNDTSEQENALKGLIERNDSLVIRDKNGGIIWSVEKYKYMHDAKKIPDTVNPSLWRNTLNNSYAGLFKVCDGIYQVRGYDMANMTFIKTDNGWIVFDVMMCKETAEAAVALMKKHFGDLNIKAALFSHSHIDHYGGIDGVMKKEDAADSKLTLAEQIASGKIIVIAPEGFLEHAVSENVYSGIAMSRRAEYQYGTNIKAGEKGGMSIGIGLGQASRGGTIGLLAPTYVVKKNESINIDGLEIQFQLTPGTEAPAEMNAYFPRYRALWLAENCTGTLHNIYTLRGAEVRDSSAWARYIIQAEQLFGDKTDVVFQSHNWPHWGTENIKKYLKNTASIYQFIYDQTLHYINLGYTSTEIAEKIKLPDELDKIWYTRQYYGTLIHNSKAVYQKYMGWYDANPVNLNLMTPERTAKKLVEYLGDVNAVLEKARKDFQKGEYQWVAQITKEIIFSDPSNQEARNLCADSLEQLAYQAESGTWRNAYLTGAMELRNPPKFNGQYGGNLINMMQDMTMDMILDYISIRNDDFEAQNDDVKINLIITDTNEKFFVERNHGVILVYKNENQENSDVTVACKKIQFIALFAGQNPEIEIKGDSNALKKLFAHCKVFTPTFNIIEP